MSSRRTRWLLRATVGAAAFFAQPILAISTPQEVRLPPLQERELPVPATFSHWRHNTQHCYSCHPTLFAQTRFGFDHGQMEAGRFCGACHDGQAAKAISAMACKDCHAP